MLVTKNLTKVFGKRKVVENINLEISQGEIVGLLGPNGAGKTTTFNMIVGLLMPNHGDVIMDNNIITKLPMYQRARLGISFLCQEPSVFKKLKVEENLLAIFEILGVDKKERQERVEMLLDDFALKQVRKQPAYTLSGGERRRLEIARAIISSPKFLLLDEPFTGIDPIARSELQELILELRKRNIGVLISDHNVRETLEITDRAYLIYEARVILSGDAQTLINNKKAREVYLGPKFRI